MPMDGHHSVTTNDAAEWASRLSDRSGVDLRQDLADDAGRGVGRDHIAALLVRDFARERLDGRCAANQHVAERLGAGDRVVESIDGLGDVVRVLRDVLVGGTPSVQAFAGEVADEEGGDVIPPHTATRIIGEVLSEIDARPV